MIQHTYPELKQVLRKLGAWEEYHDAHEPAEIEDALQSVESLLSEYEQGLNRGENVTWFSANLPYHMFRLEPSQFRQETYDCTSALYVATEVQSVLSRYDECDIQQVLQAVDTTFHDWESLSRVEKSLGKLTTRITHAAGSVQEHLCACRVYPAITLEFTRLYDWFRAIDASVSETPLPENYRKGAQENNERQRAIQETIARFYGVALDLPPPPEIPLRDIRPWATTLKRFHDKYQAHPLVTLDRAVALEELIHLAREDIAKARGTQG